ncbi:MAG TPA: hypothetical protein VKT75_19595 [Acidobacteriaceae bacterium]|nr:hypothetical protein [Acidobacteriaceae bacterium]
MAERFVMKPFRYVLLGLCLVLTAPGPTQLALAQQSGTLVFDLRNYTSATKMPKKSEKQLEHGGVRWGMLDNSLLISFVNEKFVKADTPYLTRFGEQKTLEMKAGQYTITCIGFEFNSTSTDLDKVLAKSAFFNNEVVAFTVLPGKTTTLQVFPIYEAESQRRFLAKFTFFTPDLKVQVLEDGVPKGEEVVINRRTANSVAWDDYHGPLKF